MKILVAGGRTFGHTTDTKRSNIARLERSFLASVLDDIYYDYRNLTTVIHGAANGADLWASAWARENDLVNFPVYADWQQYGKKAGYLRNVRMAEMLYSDEDYVVLFPGGKGTQMMKSIAVRRGIPIFDFMDIPHEDMVRGEDLHED